MSLRTEFETSGSRLFRYRSFLPFAAIPVLVAGLTSFQYICGSHRFTEWVQLAGLLISLSGLGVRVLAIGYAPEGTSGRNTTSQVANTLNTTGIYSIVRHPLYLGNYLVLLGLIVGLHTGIGLLLATALFYVFYERIIFAEEAFLLKQFGGEFERWAAKTPAFFPSSALWIRPDISFCWRTVLRREYTAVLIITTLFFLVDFIGDSIVERHVIIDPTWTILLIAGGMAYITLRRLKKRTRLLHVLGR